MEKSPAVAVVPVKNSGKLRFHGGNVSEIGRAHV